MNTVGEMMGPQSPPVKKALRVRTAVLASGRGSNLQALIDAWRLGELPAELVGVGSDWAGAQALERARAVGIPVRTFDADTRGAREESMAQWLDENGVQLLLLAGYMRLLSGAFVQSVGMPILNIHPSLLPAFPGLHAQRRALEAGVKFSGCTVHYVDEGMDTGPVILQREVPVLAGDDEESLSQRILQAEHLLYPEAVRLVCRDMHNYMKEEKNDLRK